jgi:hypothetical protein
MTEIEVLRRLQETTGLVGALPDKVEQQIRHAKFTRLAAWMLRDLGWGNIRKTSGSQVLGLSVDKMVNPRKGTLVDIIIDGDGDNPSVGWQERAATPDEVQLYVPPLQPEDVPGDQPPPPPPPPPVDPTAIDLLRDLVEVAGPLVDAFEANTHALLEVRDRLDQLRETGLSIHFGR